MLLPLPWRAPMAVPMPRGRAGERRQPIPDTKPSRSDGSAWVGLTMTRRWVSTDMLGRFRPLVVFATLASIMVVVAGVLWGVRDSATSETSERKVADGAHRAPPVDPPDPPGCEGWSNSAVFSLLGPRDFFETASTRSVAECLRSGADPNAGRRIGGITPLIRAARHSNPHTLAVLLDAGADPNARTYDGSTALLTAAFRRTAVFRRNDAAVITVLLDGGANPDLTYRGLDGVTALHLAADNGNVGGVVALLDHEADPNALDDRGRTPLATAARTLVDRWGRIGYHANATVVIRELLARGAKGTVPNEYGWGSLHVASLLGKDSHSIADLIKRGHDPDGKTSTGWTALHMAALVNKGPGMIAALLDGGADTDARFGNGRTPMHCAAFANRDPQLIGALVEAGADPSARTTIGWTPLHAAAYGNPNPEIVEALLEAGASTDSRLADSWAGEVHFPNSRSSMDAPSLVTLDGRWQMINGRSTPLHVGAGHARSPAIVAALLNGGADPDARDVERETPLFSAMAGLLADRIDFAVVGALLDAGADPNALNANDQTPLHKAVSFGLLEAGVGATGQWRGPQCRTRRRGGHRCTTLPHVRASS